MGIRKIAEQFHLKSLSFNIHFIHRAQAAKRVAIFSSHVVLLYFGELAMDHKILLEINHIRVKTV